MMLRLVVLASALLLQPVLGEEGLPWQAEDPPQSVRCANNGWASLQDSNGAPFADEEACRRFADEGGTLHHRVAPPPTSPIAPNRR